MLKLMKPTSRIHHPCSLQVFDLKIDNQPLEGTWNLLHVGKVVEATRGWQTPNAIATCPTTLQALVILVVDHQQNLKKNLDELKPKA
jgi:hypothetical protein